jgi:hypothetical protein
LVIQSSYGPRILMDSLWSLPETGEITSAKAFMGNWVSCVQAIVRIQCSWSRVRLGQRIKQVKMEGQARPIAMESSSFSTHLSKVLAFMIFLSTTFSNTHYNRENDIINSQVLISLSVFPQSNCNFKTICKSFR